jgi:hypothetical protein
LRLTHLPTLRDALQVVDAARAVSLATIVLGEPSITPLGLPLGNLLVGSNCSSLRVKRHVLCTL